MSANLVLPLSLGLLSNIVAELFLSLDLKLPIHALTPSQRRLRSLRWLLCCCGLIIVSAFNPAPIALISFALFSVTAATDLETKRIPPDWFTYGCVGFLCVAGFRSDGLPGLRDVVVAQAMCFVVMVLAVVLAKAASAGDVKVMMQYGASCGSLAGVGIGIISETALRVMILFVSLTALSLRFGVCRGALTRSLRMQLPHAPVAWVGLIAALIAAGAGVI